MEDRYDTIFGNTLTKNTFRIPPLCEECYVYRSDPPSKLCPGCQAYNDHLS